MTSMPVTIFPERRLSVLLCMLFLLLATTKLGHAADTRKENFPSHHAIAKNVAFWEKIYSYYSLNEAVIHDSNDLSKIYEVIPLLSEHLPGAAHINSLFQKQAREKYSEMLTRLAGRKPVTREEIRIAALFPEQNNSRLMALAADNVRSQIGQKERFLDGVINSGRYMNEIKKIIRAYHLPEELAYLPHVESSFNFKAYSKLGAAGIWQFTRDTGKQFLTIDHTIDERLDPILATHAAAKYLKNSYDVLNSWPLALTSYNYGLAGTVRAVAEEGNYENIFTYYNKGNFKFASRNFYPEFVAALKVAKRLEENQKIRIKPALTTRYFTLPGYFRLKDISNHFGITSDTIQSLNPALLSSVIRGEKRIPKGYTIRLPEEKKTSHLLATLPSSSHAKEQTANLFHRVKKGDTVASIARLHGVSIKSLMKANKLDQYATIYPNQKLRVPKPGEIGVRAKKETPRISARSIKIFNADRHSSTPVLLASNKKQRRSGKAYDTLPMKDPSVYKVFNIYRKNHKTYGYVTVQPDESLGLYESWLGTEGTKLAGLNSLPPNAHVHSGQQILLVFDQLSPSLFQKKRLDHLQETEEDFFSTFMIIGQKIYQVISGDTLWDLCYNKFDIPLWLLERYNSNMNLTSLSKEQEIIVPIIQEI